MNRPVVATRPRSWTVTSLLVAVVLVACDPVPPPGPTPAQVDEAAGLITREVLEEHVSALADDDMEGRGPGSPGDERARSYIASEMEELGLMPGGEDGSWEQPFDIVGITAAVPETWSFSRDGETLDLAWWEDFIAASGVQSETAELADAEVVFVGYGIEAPEYQWDDYKGTDLAGKVLLMLNNDPDWDPELFEGERRLYYGRWTYKYESAARQGASGAIIMHTQPSAGYPWQVVQTSWSGEQFELPAEDEPRIQVAGWTSQEATRRLVELAGLDLDELIEAAHGQDFEPVPLGVRTSLKLENRLSRVSTANVLGLLPGADPELGGEVVIYTAHHDHLGLADTDDPEVDRIYNGALDNASGVAQLLAMAKALTSLPQAPRRSILFCFVAAEEQGLLGSRYYANHPTFAPGRIAANINYDGGNIWGRTEDLTYIGYGKSSLDAVVDAAAMKQGRTVKGDQFPDRGFFYRSDQFNFAKIGVPAIYLDTGTSFIGRPEEWGREQIETWESTRYHQVSDEIDDTWNFEGMIEDVKLGLDCGVAIAQDDTLPAWNPGDEFEATRLEALEAVQE